MKHYRIGMAILGVAMILAPGIGSAADKKVDFGKREYDANCAVCHGMSGKGDGPYAGYGAQIVSDLTVLAKKNGGVFPMNRVYEIIDGRQDIKAHGPRDMPVWGTDYQIKAAEYYIDVPYDAEAYVRARVLSLVEYIYRLQER